jgi:cellulose synthase/poly-beta-1,6-N-acetylglucosamine synthase-like glycosyltransferase
VDKGEGSRAPPGRIVTEKVGVILSLFLILTAVAYSSGMFVLSRKRPRRAAVSNDHSRVYVFLVACLNEEKVILASLERLMDLQRKCVVLVIDDASDDTTAELVRGVPASNVKLFQRVVPDARKGKGAALNAGLRYLRESGIVSGDDLSHVIVCVVDADGRLDRHTLDEVDAYFADPQVGAVQIGVRMYNRGHGLLARLQDMEFVVYGEIFQNARGHLGSVGMGGNGQFMRLSALDSLEGEPWSDCLTEDLDLGVRLLAAGWTNAFCPTAAVQQQAVLSLARLLRQRSRWFQGHMQAARLMPLILREIPGRAATDLLYHLSSPALLLLTSLLPIAFLIAISDTVYASIEMGHSLMSVWWLPWFYTVTFAISNAYAFVYRKRELEIGFFSSLALAHVYVIYGYIWFISGWWAVGRALTGKQTWLKTART